MLAANPANVGSRLAFSSWITMAPFGVATSLRAMRVCGTEKYSMIFWQCSWQNFDCDRMTSVTLPSGSTIVVVPPTMPG